MEHSKSHKSWLSLGALSLLCFTACSGEAQSSEQIDFVVDHTAIATYVADREGIFEDHGLDVSLQTVGQDEPENIMMAGNADIAWMSPIEAAELVSQGEDIRYMGTAGALNMVNSVVIREEDSHRYEDVSDLEGATLGQPGFGSGTWLTFEIFLGSEFGIDDPENAFDLATADSGALRAMLEMGEIDAALLFAAESASLSFSDEFETIFTFSEAMQESRGHTLPMTGAASTSEWLENNPEATEKIQDALDDAVKWMEDNAEEFLEGGEYEELAAENGWLVNEDTSEGINDLVANGEWLLKSDIYTQDFREAITQLVIDGEGIIVDEAPALDDFLYTAE